MFGNGPAAIQTKCDNDIIIYLLSILIPRIKVLKFGILDFRSDPAKDSFFSLVADQWSGSASHWYGSTSLLYGHKNCVQGPLDPYFFFNLLGPGSRMQDLTKNHGKNHYYYDVSSVYINI